MKLKQQAADFQVEELSSVEPEKDGPFAFYRLEKEGLGTPEAIQAICRRWKIEPRRVNHGGLKDRHARTSQYLTIWHGPRRALKQSHLQLHYLGQRSQAYGSDQVLANRFQIVLRDLKPAAVDACGVALEEVSRDGVPNYFDDQRFGSVGPNRQFIARQLIDGEYEKALKLALVEPYEFDSAVMREEKRRLREHWGDWTSARSKLERGTPRSVAAYLCDRPTDFRGAFARLPAELKSLYLAAYQSYLWNYMLARWLQRECRPEQLLSIELQLGPMPVCRHLDDDQRRRFHEQLLPLPSARLHLAPDDPLKELIDDVLEKERLDLSQIKLKHFREPFFSKGDRAAMFMPGELKYAANEDDLHAGRQKLTLRFTLPRGCYATMLVKRVTQAK
jgi:tRNA pseudouridine13 synthase